MPYSTLKNRRIGTIMEPYDKDRAPYEPHVNVAYHEWEIRDVHVDQSIEGRIYIAVRGVGGFGLSDADTEQLVRQLLKFIDPDELTFATGRSS
jgi:hypothetical protein